MLRSSPLVALVAALLLSGCGKDPDTNTVPKACEGRVHGDLVISEFFPDPQGVDTGKEYIELFNATAVPISLDGMTLRYTRLDGSAEKKAALKRGTLAPGQYYVIGDARAEPIPAHMDDTYGDALGALGNTGGKISILCGTQLLDEVVYSKSKENAARIFDGAFRPDAIVNDDEARWCNATVQTDGFFGSPRRANARCEPEVIVDPTCKGGVHGDLVITEFMANPAGVDTGKEYIEIYNRTGAPIDLTGFTLRYSRADGTGAKSTKLKEGVVPSRKYFTLGDVAQDALPPHIDLGYGTGIGALGNTDGNISLWCETVLIDEVIYTRAPKENAARVLDGNQEPDANLNGDEGAWCDAKAPYGSFFGSPRAPNEACGSVAVGCLDPTSGELRPPRPPSPESLIVSEVMGDPTGVDAEREWFELHAFEDMDLNGVVISRDTLTGTNRVTLGSEECMAVTAGQYLVLSRRLSPDINGGIASPIATFNFSLPNAGGVLFISYEGTLIDRAAYPGLPQGFSAELSADRLEAWVNDSEYAWCAGEIEYGVGGKGTPGLPNRTCPSPVAPGECRDADTGLARNIAWPGQGDLVVTEVMAAPTPNAGTNVERPKEWFEFTSTAVVDLNELEVSNDQGSSRQIRQAGCYSVQPGQHLLFAQTVDAAINGGLPQPHFTFEFELFNSGSTATPERAVILRSQGSELDRFSWTASTAGASIQLSSTVAPSPWANDLPENLCTTPEGVTYGEGDRGTPGQPNVACP